MTWSPQDLVGRIEGQALEEGRKDTLVGTSVKISSLQVTTLRSCGTFSSFLCVVKITPYLFVFVTNFIHHLKDLSLLYVIKLQNVETHHYSNRQALEPS